MILQKNISTDSPKAWLEQYAQEHPGRDKSVHLLMLVPVKDESHFELRLIRQHSKFKRKASSLRFQDAAACIEYSPLELSAKEQYQAALTQHGLTARDIALALGYASAQSMQTSTPYKRGDIFARVLAAVNQQPPPEVAALTKLFTKDLTTNGTAQPSQSD